MKLDEIRRRLASRTPAEVSRPKEAAVAAVLRANAHPTSGAEILLIRRAERPGDPWSGQMAFPGGRRDDEDSDLLNTAMRETWEEVGLQLSKSNLLGRLDDLPTHTSGLLVRPFVFELSGEFQMRPNHEVAEAFWSPLAPLRAGQRNAKFDYEHKGQMFSFPAFNIEERVVWGLTYRMLQMLLGL